MTDHPKSPCGETIRVLRRAKGWTQEDLARNSGLVSVKMIETGRRNGRFSTLEKIARALGVEVSGLFSSGAPRCLPKISHKPNKPRVA